MPVLHDLSCFSPLERLRELINELREKDAEAYKDDIAQLEEDLKYSEELHAAA